MPHIEPKRYAVVSCHVERPFDDRTWEAFARIQAQRPGGFAIAALMRPPDLEAGESEELWLERAREASAAARASHALDEPDPRAAERRRSRGARAARGSVAT